VNHGTCVITDKPEHPVLREVAQRLGARFCLPGEGVLQALLKGSQTSAPLVALGLHPHFR